MKPKNKQQSELLVGRINKDESRNYSLQIWTWEFINESKSSSLKFQWIRYIFKVSDQTIMGKNYIMSEKRVLTKAMEKIHKNYKRSILQCYIDPFGHLRINGKF